jgi:uncharacterized membrane protein (UPF0127 family)
MMKKMIASACLVLASWGVLADMPRMEFNIGMYRIEAEVAADQKNRMQGLMNRRAMAAQQGMLFVFTEANRHCMWMRNTYLPLSVAFLDDQGVILNIEDMEPQTENNHCAAKPARFALEMNKGWFAQKGVKPGAKLSGIEKAPAAQ